MKTQYKNIKFLSLLLIIASLFGCGTGETSKDPAGTITIQSPSFPEIQGMVSKVIAYLEIAGLNCPLTVESDTTLNGQCPNIPNGTYSYTLKYIYTDTGVTLATTGGTATMESGQNHELSFPALYKYYDDDGDGYANIVEIVNGSNPKDNNSVPSFIDTTPPATPGLLSPTAGSSTSDNTPAFDWSDVTDPSGMSYEIQVDNNSDFTSPEINQYGLTVSNYTPTTSLSDGTYYWTVRARDGSSNIASDGNPANPSAWSAPWSITINTTTSTSGLVAYYPFNGNANDESGNGYSGTVNGATLTTDRFGNASSAYSFDGINDYIGLANTGALKFTSGGFTLAAWVNFNNTNTDTMIIGKHTCGYSNGYFLGIGGANNTASNRLNLFVNSDPRLLTSETYNDGNWHLVAGVYDGTNQYLYVDGVLKSSQTKTYSSTNNIDISIGRASGNCGFFNGLIDNVRIYNRPLSTSEIEALSPPSAPTGVIATAGDGQATINWNAVTGATSYNIYWSTTSGVTKSTGTKLSNVTNPYIHTGRTNGTAYYYVVTAVNSYGESGESSQVSATPQATDTSAPTNPTATSGYSSSSKTTTLTSGNWYNYSIPYFEWSGASDSSSGVAGYYVYFGTDGTADPATSGTYQTSSSYTVSAALTSGSTYYLRIKAKDNAGNVASSTYAAFTFQYDSSGPTNTTGSNFINSGAASTNSTNVTLTLSATDSAGVTGYCAKESSATPSVNETCWTSITSITSYSAGVTFTLSSGDGAKTVYVWFKDTAGNVSSVVSDSITLATIPSAPTGVTAAAGDGQATISWNPVNGATSYNIYWSTTSGVTKNTGTKISGITATSYTHTGLTNGTAYYYMVTAANDFGESGESNQVMVIPPQIPISLPKTGQTTCYDSSGNAITCAGTGQDGDLQRGVAWPNPRFTDNGDSTVADNLTGLVWTKDGNAPGPVACTPAVTKTWQAALDYVTCLNTNSYLGYTDWRLPNIVELESLIDAEQWEQALPAGNPFTNVQYYDYWSSTNSTYNGINGAWVVSMGYGNVASFIKTNFNYVWPVRSGQSWLFGSSIISLSKTGQTTCYDGSGNVITCAGTGQDGDNQSGVTWPNPRFIDNGDGTVTDNLTGLVWTKDGNAPGPAACSPAGSKTWPAALDYVACLNANSYLGYTNWRLPNINELGSLLHYGKSNLATWLNTQGFNNVRGYYWSSTTHASNSIYAWVVGVGSGVGAYYKSDGSYYYVWPVHSGQ